MIQKVIMFYLIYLGTEIKELTPLDGISNQVYKVKDDKFGVTVAKLLTNIKLDDPFKQFELDVVSLLQKQHYSNFKHYILSLFIYKFIII